MNTRTAALLLISENIVFTKDTILRHPINPSKGERYQKQRCQVSGVKIFIGNPAFVSNIEVQFINSIVTATTQEVRETEGN